MRLGDAECRVAIDPLGDERGDDGGGLHTASYSYEEERTRRTIDVGDQSRDAE